MTAHGGIVAQKSAYNLLNENSGGNGEGDGDFKPNNRKMKPTKKGANKNDKKQIDRLSKKYGVDRHKFGEAIEDFKQSVGRGGRDNLSNKQLEEIANGLK